MRIDRNGILLKVEDLSTHFHTSEGVVKAVQSVSFEIVRGRTFALVGESGCGKSVTALSIMRLVQPPQGRIVSGSVDFEGVDLATVAEKRMRDIRGSRIAMIFQEPTSALNPVFTIGNQIAESIRLHQHKSRSQSRLAAAAMLERVGLADPLESMRRYPHQLSGGMCQRVMIAMAVSCRPSLLIADEPTTALDVTIQAQILDLIDELRGEQRMSVMLITHDLGIVSQRADDVAVMYASRLVETAPCEELFQDPLHPYTRGLLQAVPRLGMRQSRLKGVPGTVPEPLDLPAGCSFYPRCESGRRGMLCRRREPELVEVRPGRKVACWMAGPSR